MTTKSSTALESIKLEDTLNKTWKNGFTTSFSTFFLPFFSSLSLSFFLSFFKKDKSGFGFRMLQKMGWNEEKGLGKNEDGISTSLKVTKREEGLGLGINKDSAGNNGWNQTIKTGKKR